MHVMASRLFHLDGSFSTTVVLLSIRFDGMTATMREEKYQLIFKKGKRRLVLEQVGKLHHFPLLSSILPNNDGSGTLEENH